MEEQQSQDAGSRKRNKQQISVPFFWEEKPGVPKQDWTPNSLSSSAAFPPVLLLLPPPPQPSPRLLMIPPSPLPPMAPLPENIANSPPPLPSSCPPPPPIGSMPEKSPSSPPLGAPLPSRPPPPPPPKFVVSVPFKWEEKPGTPMQTVAQRPSLAPKVDKRLALPPAYSHLFECFESDGESSFDDDDEPEWLRELDQDAYSRQLTTEFIKQISSTIPLEAPSSPESESGSSTSSYATGSTSPVGSSFLEQLFPLYTPKANPPGNLVACVQRGFEANPTKVKGLRGESERSIVIRRPQTLGELIMLSRRRSYMQRSVLTRKKSVSKEYEEPSDHGCCMFGGGNGGIAKLLGGKSLLTLKFA